MDVFGLGGKVPGGVQRDEPGATHRPHGRQQTGLIEGAVQFIKETEQVAGFDRIKGLADVIVRGDALDLEERTGVVATARRFHVLLETQERRALGEEHRESGRGDVGHGEVGIAARASIRQPGGDNAPPSHQMIKGTGIHGPRIDVPPQKYKLQSCDKLLRTREHAPQPCNLISRLRSAHLTVSQNENCWDATPLG